MQIPTILIATTNGEKFTILRNLLSLHLPPATNYLIPVMKGCSREEEEYGTIRDRSRRKAELHKDCCGQECDFILGSDDGLRVEGYEGGRVLADSKRITQDIILGKMIKPGCQVDVIRAFWLMDRQRSGRGATSVIPFVFLGNKQGVTLKPGTYPLSRVLAIPGSDKPVYEEKEHVRSDHYLRYSRNIKRLFSAPKLY